MPCQKITVDGSRYGLSRFYKPYPKPEAALGFRKIRSLRSVLLFLVGIWVLGLGFLASLQTYGTDGGRPERPPFVQDDPTESVVAERVVICFLCIFSALTCVVSCLWRGGKKRR